MSAETTDTANAGEQSTERQQSEWKAPASQEELDRIINDRLARERKKYEGHSDYKAKAEQFDKLQESQKSNEQKTAEALAKAQKDAEDARVDALKYRLGTKHKLSDEDVDLFLTGRDEATLTAQAEAVAKRLATAAKQGNHVAREGATSPAVGGGDEREFARALFGGK